MENEVLFYILGVLSGVVPVTIIFLTLRRMRKKRETPIEREERHGRKKTLTEQLKSVEQERLEKKEGTKKPGP